MAENHPSEIELLEYVERELEDDVYAAMRPHVDSCATCTTLVAELERAREALGTSPILELPPARRRAILEGLPDQERDRPARLGFLSPKRLAVVLVPAAAVVVAVVVTTTGGGDAERQAASDQRAEMAATAEAAQAPPSDEAGAAGAAEEAAPAPEAAPPEEPPSAEAAPAPADTSAMTLAAVASVEGTAEQVAAILREEGLTVSRVEPNLVEVTGASADEVGRALEGLQAGPVEVFVLP